VKPARWLWLGLLLRATLACDADPGGTTEEAGGRIYAQLECAGCHESAAVPGLSVSPLRALSSRYNEESLTAYLEAPPPPMPRFELSQVDRRVLAAYLLSRFD
jgi:mono/diheme cytochrome c family protein